MEDVREAITILGHVRESIVYYQNGIEERLSEPMIVALGVFEREIRLALDLLNKHVASAKG